jgi:hypothetical protein
MTGADVIDYRRRRNMSRKALAAACGLTEGKVWRIENKNVIHDDERTALDLVGVIPSGNTLPGQPIRIPPPAPPPVAIITVNETQDNFLPLTPVVEEVDFAALVRVMDKRYERYVSNSEIQSFKRCRRKWWLAWHRGLHLRHESPIGPRQIGNRLHRALQFHYSPSGPIDLLAALEGLILQDRAAMEGNPLVNDDVRAKFEKEADLERIMMEGYLQWIAETGADSELEVVAAEQYVEAGLAEFDDKVAIIGKLDVRLRRKIDNVYLFMDHKSVASFGDLVRMLPLNEQMMHYHLLEAMALGDDGLRTEGALYNMMRRVRRTAAAKPPFFERVEVRHNVHTVENYRRRIVGEITDMMEVADQLNAGASHHTVAYPSPTRDCAWDCPFLAICPMFDDGSRVEDMIKQYYDEGDPLDYYKNEVLGVNE